jgi:hypothetical protein
MSGILDSKQRIIDFIFTRNGYSQIQNNDIRIVYASLSDKDAIYETKQGEINVADTDINPFLFEAYSKYNDTLNTELDLRQTNIFSIRTDLNNVLYDISNNVSQKNIEVDIIDSLFFNINNKIKSNIGDECILLSQNYLNYDKETQQIKPIEINLSKINNYSDAGYFVEDNSLFNIPLNLAANNNNYETILSDKAINLDKYTMLSDERFQYKLNYLFLPPSNMNTNAVSLNPDISNHHVMKQDTRDKRNVIFKNLVSNSSISVTTQDGPEQIILKSIDKLESLSKAGKISKITFDFNKFEYDSEFLINLFEKSYDSNSRPIFNKLLFVNHGEIFDKTENKNKQIYSVGKLYQTKINSKVSNDISGQLVEDNYMFINLFTIVLK